MKTSSRRRDERGGIAVLSALVAVGLFGFAALGIAPVLRRRRR